MKNIIPNLRECRDGIWGGGTPLPEGWDYLKSIGINRVIKLNTDRESNDSYASKLGMTLYKFPITLLQQVITRPSLSDMHAAVALIRPGTFVHCGSFKRTLSADAAEDNRQGGQNRTNLILGAYLLTLGVAKDDAYQWMCAGDFYSVWEQGLNGRWDSLDPVDWICQ